ncbi:MAG TPA: aldo/keto reductase [Bacteroidota bacterium]|jgi:aryl-alcohol dehydrogenase (NADP+)|nr:aldo/keto reductase [Bacteroidota bacterium]
MIYTQLGKSDLNVSRLCLGVMTYGSKSWRPWVLEEDESRPFIQRALELGINFFDTADMYSRGVSEEILGRAIRDFADRSKIILATKVFFPTTDDPRDRGLSRYHIMDAIDKSLKRLGTDFVDLYQIHRFDTHTPIEETMQALHDVVKSGKARYIGASSMFTYQFAKMQHAADMNHWTRFISMQNHYNLVYREEEREMIPYCREEGIAIIPWSPLARGFLTGSRKRGQQDSTQREQFDQYAKDLYYQEEDYQIADRVVELAKRKYVKPALVALAWLLHKPGVTAPIIGATKMPHLEDAVAALEVTLSDEEMKFLEQLYVPHKVLGHG